MGMTPREQSMWDYLEDESTDLMMKVRDNVYRDGFDQAVPDETMAVEHLALKILSAAMIKMLAIISENRGVDDLMKAYVDMAPMHADLLKTYMLGAIR